MTPNINHIDGLWIATEQHSGGTWYGISAEIRTAIAYMEWHKVRDQAAQKRLHY